MTTPYDVKEIWTSVERVATGGASYTAGETEMVEWLTRQLGLKRSPESYARRTRQRYQTASRRGLTAQEINREEYLRRQARKRNRKRGPGSNVVVGELFSEKLRRLIDRRNFLLPEVKIDEEYLEDYIDIFGEGNVIDLLEQQIDSAEHYQRGDSEPGHRRWEERNPTNPRRIRADFTTYIGNTDVMYYYHSHR